MRSSILIQCACSLTGKSVCLFYIDLIHDVVSMTLFLVFMLTFFVQNPSRLPIYMMADVIQAWASPLAEVTARHAHAKCARRHAERITPRAYMNICP